ncbi:MAG: hypothetical protein CMO10_03550 [Thalassospira sp.]|nr:hypothetical protein [Thalassospira sp.]
MQGLFHFYAAGEGLSPWFARKRGTQLSRDIAHRAMVRRAKPKDKKQPKGWFLQFLSCQLLISVL